MQDCIASLVVTSHIAAARQLGRTSKLGTPLLNWLPNEGRDGLPKRELPCAWLRLFDGDRQDIRSEASAKGLRQQAATIISSGPVTNDRDLHTGDPDMGS